MNVFSSWTFIVNRISFTLLKNNNTLLFYFFWYKKIYCVSDRISKFIFNYPLRSTVYFQFTDHINIYLAVFWIPWSLPIGLLTKKFQYINTLIKKDQVYTCTNRVAFRVSVLYFSIRNIFCLLAKHSTAKTT